MKAGQRRPQRSSQPSRRIGDESVAVTVDTVTKRFGTEEAGGVVALDNVSLTVPDGQLVALLGPSGCGKSTLLRIIGGLLTPTEGTVALYGNEVTEPSELTGMMFQRPVLFPWLTALDNILMPVKVRKGKAADHTDRAHDLIKLVGLEGFADSYPWQLSGGMQQRVAICRMLINEPRVLLLDEPFGALDELTREFMDSELRRVIVQEQRSAVLVTHNPLEAVFVADRVIVLTPRPGRIGGEVAIDLGRERPESMFSAPEVHRYVAQVRELFEANRGERHV
ncbi:MAG: ABC transporter ATP-binding protein [Acidimicrobiia bacterium]|nr:ABC transporter ATP-binding protein [Acidimicrobiia bacterium]MDH5293367.1 ABC transporter ATP-binding protein [Acidimicrobiia bacterium]